MRSLLLLCKYFNNIIEIFKQCLLSDSIRLSYQTKQCIRWLRAITRLEEEGLTIRIEADITGVQSRVKTWKRICYIVQFFIDCNPNSGMGFLHEIDPLVFERKLSLMKKSTKRKTYSRKVIYRHILRRYNAWRMWGVPSLMNSRFLYLLEWMRSRFFQAGKKMLLLSYQFIFYSQIIHMWRTRKRSRIYEDSPTGILKLQCDTSH